MKKVLPFRSSGGISETRKVVLDGCSRRGLGMNLTFGHGVARIAARLYALTREKGEYELHGLGARRTGGIV